MRLIDADALCRSLVDWMFESFGKDDGHDVEFELINKVVAGIDAHPTIDAVPVVRCGECKHRFVDGDNVRYNVCMLNHNKVQPDDWFCADGERKDGADSG